MTVMIQMMIITSMMMMTMFKMMSMKIVMQWKNSNSALMTIELSEVHVIFVAQYPRPLVKRLQWTG